MKCTTCFHQCEIPEGGRGFCRARICENGKIRPDNYGCLTSLALDPIEKKPLYEFYPGSLILSAGSYGCNLRCPFCQNYEISQENLHGRSLYVSPEQLVEEAKKFGPAGNIGIAFTYNEPMIGWEYMRDTAKLAKENDLQVVVVTNGTASQEALEEILPFVDAFNIDLKGFTDPVYQSYVGSLEQVKAFIERAARDAHVEITSLIVPGKNDSLEQMEEQAKWLASVDPDIPLHITRYFPRWKETEDPTDIEQMKQLQKVAEKYLHKVYLGNV
ncbi:AmmeMemoRadiSam system radical SAM enzyme [Faecalibaculum rodentium]|uniref:AmmeMemoRadiSam system radical SAM enzyme n=1 Tax=Faecalibaculum rodentium TaxID=1702221 RepID=A0A1Q9YLT6_9FIRM|nr:AmmeMemoRadiSam system radical SAM enzyme [Faecalibaculum rodentium]OLU45912.1 AmmeMemoRadiSam system radical SAM enzyme [Faecalibaculum rodentium]